MFRTALVLAVIAAICSAHVPRFGGPTIAIFATPTDACHTIPADIEAPSGCVYATYVRWLEAAGIRTVPLPWNDHLQSQLAILKKVNGVLFTGGSLDARPALYRQFYAKAVDLFETALEWNRRGDRFVVWGTCQGFQLITMMATRNMSAVEDGYTGMSPTMLPLQNIKPGNRIFAGAPASVIAALQTNATLNYHHEGVPPSTYTENANLTALFDVVSTNVDSSNRPFVSTIEAKNAAVYGVQWHPEWPPFDYSKAAIQNTDAAIEVSRYMAVFLRSELQRNAHRFASAEELEGLVMEQSPMTYAGYGNEWFWVAATRGKKESFLGSAAFDVLLTAVLALVVGFLAGYLVASLLKGQKKEKREATGTDYEDFVQAH